MSVAHHRRLAMAAVRDAHPAHRHAVARRRAEGRGGDGRRGAALDFFRYIVLPHLMRPITVVILIETIFLLNVFAEIKVTSVGGFAGNLTYLVFSQLNDANDVGEAAAGGLIAVVLANIVPPFLVGWSAAIWRHEAMARRNERCRNRQRPRSSPGLIGLLMFFPILWTALAAFKTEADAYSLPENCVTSAGRSRISASCRSAPTICATCSTPWSSPSGRPSSASCSRFPRPGRWPFSRPPSRASPLPGWVWGAHHPRRGRRRPRHSPTDGLEHRRPPAARHSAASDLRRAVRPVGLDAPHRRHSALDAVDQDDAAGRRADSDLSDLQPERPHLQGLGIDQSQRLDAHRHSFCRHGAADDAPEPADRHLDALYLLQGDPVRDPRGGADGRREPLERVDQRSGADGVAGNRLDRAAQRHPRLERGILDLEPHQQIRRAA